VGYILSLVKWNDALSSLLLPGHAGKNVDVFFVFYFRDALVALGEDEVRQLGRNYRGFKVVASVFSVASADNSCQWLAQGHDSSGVDGIVLRHGGHFEGCCGGVWKDISNTLWALDALVVGLALEVLDGFLVQQVSSSSDKHFVLAFSAVWALVGAFETVELELS